MKLFILIFATTFLACKSDAVKPPLNESIALADTTVAPDTDYGCVWLTEVIEKYLNSGGYAIEDICTSKYYEYKNDAIQVGLDGGMDEASFIQKWSQKYVVKYAGQGAGFLVSAQDWTKIIVKNCKLTSTIGSNPLNYNVILEETSSKVTFNRDIKIIPVGDAFLIDDVVEYDQ